MREADMECKVAFPSFHFILFAKFFISLVTAMNRPDHGIIDIQSNSIVK